MGKKRILISAFACHPPTSSEHQEEEKILGSGESILGWNLVKQISRIHEVWVITQRRNAKGIRRAVDQGEMADVKFCYFDFPVWHRTLWYWQISLHFYYYFWQIFAFLKAKKLHRKNHFDLVHHITYANYWMPSFMGAFLKIPFIWGPVGGGQKTPPGFYKEYSLGGKISELVRGISQWIGIKLLYSRSRCLRRSKAILVCNQETKNKIPEKFKEKVQNFPVTGIGQDALRPDRYVQKDHNIFSVITTGRLVHWKNFAEALTAFHIFFRKYPQSQFFIIGDGPEKDRLETMSSELNLKNHVHFISWLPQNELFKRMCQSDVFLYPSLREGGGAVVIEAMASGLPVICLDTAGPGFHIRKEWGIKIEPRNPDFVVGGMAQSLEKLYEDKDLRQQMGIKAYERAKDYYLWDRLGERLQNIYRDSLEKDRK